MKRDRHPVAGPPAASGTTNGLPSAERPSGTEPIEEIGSGDTILDSLRTRLFHEFRADFRHDPALWAASTRVIVHAIRTFGSEEKAHSWITSKCGALDNQRPYELLKAGKSQSVDEELSRIDYGVYA